MIGTQKNKISTTFSQKFYCLVKFYLYFAEQLKISQILLRNLIKLFLISTLN